MKFEVPARMFDALRTDTFSIRISPPRQGGEADIVEVRGMLLQTDAEREKVGNTIAADQWGVFVSAEAIKSNNRLGVGDKILADPKTGRPELTIQKQPFEVDGDYLLVCSVNSGGPAWARK